MLYYYKLCRSNKLIYIQSLKVYNIFWEKSRKIQDEYIHIHVVCYAKLVIITHT